MTEPTEFYRKYRPKRFADVIGQPEAVKMLAEMVKNNRVPHALLFTGPSGCGKTTLARILKSKLKCSDADFEEINAAKERGIDMVRDVGRRVGMSAMGGDCRIWLIDEAHNVTRREGGDAQTALLKMLEDVPRHVYFILCTTEPQGLLKTIHTRCTEIRFNPLSTGEIKSVVSAILLMEEKTIKSNVMDQLAECSEGSARKALVLLNQIIGLESEAEMLDALKPPETVKVAFDLVKALLWQNVKWTDISKIITELKETDWEGIRRLILANAATTLLKGNGNPARVNAILCCFESNWFDSGRAGLVRACYEVFQNK